MRPLRDQIGRGRRTQGRLLGGTAVAVAALGALVYWPARARSAELGRAASDAEVELAANEARAVDLPGVAAEVNRLRDDLRLFRKLPAQMPLYDFLDEASGRAQAMALRDFSCTRHPSAAGAAGAQYQELPVRLEFEGDFANAFAFLRGIEALPQMMRTKSLHVERLAGPDADPGQIRCAATISLYWREPE